MQYTYELAVDGERFLVHFDAADDAEAAERRAQYDGEREYFARQIRAAIARQAAPKH